MACAPGWRTTERVFSGADRMRIVMKGGYNRCDEQLDLLQRRIHGNYQISMQIDRAQPTLISSHNALVDMMMAMDRLQLPMLVMLCIADFLPEAGPWSLGFKSNVLISTRKSIQKVILARTSTRAVNFGERKLFCDTPRGRQRLTDIRWYEAANQADIIILDFKTPKTPLPSPPKSKQPTQPSRKRKQSTQPSRKKATIASTAPTSPLSSETSSSESSTSWSSTESSTSDSSS